ncbi:MAG: hypothetical protein KDK91_23745, partial [Gammaproteobacteria bacterium]|nr:hypothetical protein [Gammaproteobacteria bacterium]
VFELSGDASAASSNLPARIDLKHIEHGYDPEIDPDVPRFTDVTSDPILPPLYDRQGREYALLTLYQVDPPLADLPSREPGVDRGLDMRSPADLVKSAYSNYVSAVFTDDAEKLAVPNHPIGHFFVKLMLGGHPVLYTGMTTIQRADQELVALSFGQQLGIGGVLLTPQPGRLNSATEVRDELALRQRRLRVIDGLHYRIENGRNVGPEHIITDGNVVFARFKLPAENARDALDTFVEYIARGQYRRFGSLLSRPHRGSGAGCAAFAMSWLKAAGVIPFVEEPPWSAGDAPAVGVSSPDKLWRELHRTIHVPWAHLGCDARSGAAAAYPADYTFYDLLLHGESRSDLMHALPGLVERIRADQGVVSATLFEFGARTPLRDLLIAHRRKDDRDIGDYRWAPPGQGLAVGFWDNGLFSRWIKRLWRQQSVPTFARLVKEGRFLGVEIDAMQLARRNEAFFVSADRLRAERAVLRDEHSRPRSCRALFGLGLY